MHNHMTPILIDLILNTSDEILDYSRFEMAASFVFNIIAVKDRIFKFYFKDIIKYTATCENNLIFLIWEGK